MTGGFSGTRPSVSQKTQDAQSAAIESGLKTDLAAEVTAKIPEDYILLPGATFTSFQAVPPASGDNGKVNVQEKGTATAYLSRRLRSQKR